jgi:hypothetical protein
MTFPVLVAQPGGSPEELNEIVRSRFAALPSSPAGTAAAFATKVVQFVIGWLQHRPGADMSSLADAIFLCPEHPSLVAPSLGFSKVHFFAGDPRQPVCGASHLCAFTLNDVYVRPSSAGSSTSEIVRGLIAENVGKLPAVIFSPAIGARVILPMGLEDEESKVLLTTAGSFPAVTKASLDEFLTEFHDILLKTPRPFKRFWNDVDAFVPVPNAEKEVQNAMIPLAELRFRGSVVRYEEAMVEGRADLTISPNPQGTTLGSGVLELKALRSRFPAKGKGKARICQPAKNDEAIIDGIDQADSYRERRGLEHAFVCCYDFRSDEEAVELDAHEPRAADRKVNLRRYRVYNHAKTLRRDKPKSAHRAAVASKRAK